MFLLVIKAIIIMIIIIIIVIIVIIVIIIIIIIIIVITTNFIGIRIRFNVFNQYFLLGMESLKILHFSSYHLCQ